LRILREKQSAENEKTSQVFQKGFELGESSAGLNTIIQHGLSITYPSEGESDQQLVVLNYVFSTLLHHFGLGPKGLVVVGSGGSQLGESTSISVGLDVGDLVHVVALFGAGGLGILEWLCLHLSRVVALWFLMNVLALLRMMR
jgi:hypothetical protein